MTIFAAILVKPKSWRLDDLKTKRAFSNIIHYLNLDNSYLLDNEHNAHTN